MDAHEIQVKIATLEAEVAALREESKQYLTRKNALSDVDQGRAFENLGITRIVHRHPEDYVRVTDTKAIFESQQSLQMALHDQIVSQIDSIRSELNSRVAEFSQRTNIVERKLDTMLALTPNPLPTPPIPSFNVTSLNTALLWIESVTPLLDTMRMALLHAGIINEQR